MKHIRWSDNDHYWGPFTYARDKYNNLALVLGSGDDDYPGCRLRMNAFGHTLIASLPPIIRPWKRRVSLSPGMANIVGNIESWEKHEREYGFSYSKSGAMGDGGFLQVFFGAQTHDSSTTQSWLRFTPWNNWRHVRHSMYDLDGNHFWTEPEHRKGEPWDHASWYSAKDACPSRSFSFLDFDGEEITAKTQIEERQWELGTGWFKWLSHFRKPIVRRSIAIDFSKETGRRKGSWKGGTIGTGFDMLPGELHEAAFRRYCSEHEMTFIGEDKSKPEVVEHIEQT